MLKHAILLMEFSALTMAGTVSFKPIAFPGLQMHRATDPIVQSFVSAALGISSQAEAVRNLLPYSVVIDNETAHTIVAYTLQLTFVDADGKSGRDTREYFNLETKSNGMEIPARSQRLVTPFWSFHPGIAQFKAIAGPSHNSAVALIARLRSQVAVAISIDLIIFDNGRVIGPDEANTLSYIEGYLKGEQETALLVVDAMNKGESPEQISNQVRKRIAELRGQNTFEAHAQAAQASRFMRLATSSPNDLYDEAQRVIGKAPFSLYR